MFPVTLGCCHPSYKAVFLLAAEYTELIKVCGLPEGLLGQLGPCRARSCLGSTFCVTLRSCDWKTSRCSKLIGMNSEWDGLKLLWLISVGAKSDCGPCSDGGRQALMFALLVSTWLCAFLLSPSFPTASPLVRGSQAFQGSGEKPGGISLLSELDGASLQWPGEISVGLGAPENTSLRGHRCLQCPALPVGAFQCFSSQNPCCCQHSALPSFRCFCQRPLVAGPGRTLSCTLSTPLLPFPPHPEDGVGGQ